MSKENYQLNRHRVGGILSLYNVPAESVAFIRGNVYYPEFDSDTNYDPLKCEPSFRFLFGVEYKDISAFFVVKTGDFYFLLARPDPELFFFSMPFTEEEAINKWGAKGIVYEDELEAKLKELKPPQILIMEGVDTISQKPVSPYSHPIFKKEEFASLIDRKKLFPAVNDSRNIRTEEEVKYMAKACEMSSLGHKEAMRKIKVGQFEFNLAALFQSQCYEMDYWAYPPICGAGKNASYLHYELNDQQIKNGDLILCDMGAAYKGLCADITCTFPVNGKFSDWQQKVYNVVLNAQVKAVAKLKPNINYGDIQTEAYKDLLKGLVEIELMKGDVEEMYAKLVHKVWMPHRLGHYIGYRVHDVGQRSNEEGKEYKFIELSNLVFGQCLTIEPGIYFIDMLLNDARKNDKISSYFIWDKITEAQKEVGGVRIEDTLYITQTGFENLTKVPRTVKEIEDWMASK